MGRILNFWWHFKWIDHDDPELGNFVQLSTVLRVFKQVLGTNPGLTGQENDTVENWEKSLRVLKPDLHLFSDLLAFGDHFVQLGHLFAGLHNYESDADCCKHFVLVQKRLVVRVLWQQAVLETVLLRPSVFYCHLHAHIQLAFNSHVPRLLHKVPLLSGRVPYQSLQGRAFVCATNRYWPHQKHIFYQRAG